MSFIKKLIPESLLKLIRPVYHGLLAIYASFYYGNPAGQMIVIGITGTAGKSTTAAILAHILNSSGKKAGYITTVNFFDGEKNFLNKHGLSMPGGLLLQKQLRQMLDAGCKYAIIECTSEGLAQHRHFGINFDVALFTNLSHAHLESHGSFGNYQKAKSRLFDALQKFPAKDFFTEKMIGVNFDDPMSGYFLSFPSQKKFGITFSGIKVRAADLVFDAAFKTGGAATDFKINDQDFSLDLLGQFNARNAGLAAACACMLGVSLSDSAKALNNFHGVPGRMEKIINNLGINIIVDYGCEPESIKSSLEAAAQIPHNKLIHVFGSTGGHRDISKRFVFGKTSAQYADEIIITNDDVYDTDPLTIAKNIEEGIESFKLRKPNYQIILDRRQAIKKALSIARTGDLVLITGKGSEQFLVLPGNKRIAWDEREVVKNELRSMN